MELIQVEETAIAVTIQVLCIDIVFLFNSSRRISVTRPSSTDSHHPRRQDANIFCSRLQI